ncbi:type II toxin-antitoxin system RelE/ParE family toxin [endosymbiont GvMRE of Glomus versiforme]|uniref:type II toxin-antitoxin system RelE/ParE family toxin n=1 Tax=endosymbiont GvMRE of Glomus versiforme TaxID=2039283 RepID=UPI000EC775A1|nr:type II toxin-antitoxin system RelE/ParE family toxin [endosymbiont GvMRE of Glomus versiforme]RHZ36366.1 Plasmid maintenance system killer protein [endosymbiont GvMRE of Glomus versiforme]
MIKTFHRWQKDLEQFFYERKPLLKLKNIEKVLSRKLEMLDAALDLRVLTTVPHNRLERLKGKRQGQHSIRINKQYRICFIW